MRLPTSPPSILWGWGCVWKTLNNGFGEYKKHRNRLPIYFWFNWAKDIVSSVDLQQPYFETSVRSLHDFSHFKIFPVESLFGSGKSFFAFRICFKRKIASCKEWYAKLLPPCAPVENFFSQKTFGYQAIHQNTIVRRKSEKLQFFCGYSFYMRFVRHNEDRKRLFLCSLIIIFSTCTHFVYLFSLNFTSSSFTPLTSSSFILLIIGVNFWIPLRKNLEGVLFATMHVKTYIFGEEKSICIP